MYFVVGINVPDEFQAIGICVIDGDLVGIVLEESGRIWLRPDGEIDHKYQPGGDYDQGDLYPDTGGGCFYAALGIERAVESGAE